MNRANPIALVTGGAQRIGADIVLALHKSGYDIAIHYHSSKTPAESLCGELNNSRENSVHCFQADLSQTDQAEQLATAVVNHFGRVDALVNNASSFYPTTLGTVKESHWEDLFGSNVKGAFFLTQALIDTLKKNGGSVTNIIDVHAERPLKHYSVYTMAKASLGMMTKSLARELAPDIRVNGVSPGAILWPEQGEDAFNNEIKQSILSRIPLGRPGEPADIARTVVFLCKHAPYITGQIIAVDGGRLLNT